MGYRFTDAGEQISRPAYYENENVLVADMVFSFNNHELISALRERGKEIVHQRFDKVQKQDFIINDLF